MLSRNPTVESGSEEFRSVIDDLTVENRKLRKKLRKYEQTHCGELQGDKLFELRVHGLPASKKRKLEKALQEFASSLVDLPDDDQLPSAFAQNLARVPARKSNLHHHASSSGTSNSRTLGDSAYASMSNSSNAHVSRGESSNASAGALLPNDKAVRAYLQKLSRGVLPKHPPVLTEKTKRQVVVQRLEQVFTGSRDSSSKESQSKQQQEVSQSAANADRKSSEAQGYQVAAEGRRESKIFTSEEDLKHGTYLSALERIGTDSPGTASSTAATPDQRPTRPLDLDPSRAQIPEENIEYIKHLGFDSPQMQLEKILAEDEGWIYLNLLTSMAQLHILNVTPEFVRNAIRDFSSQLELSNDGARIRWKGGKKPTRIPIDSGEMSTHSSNYSYDLVVPQTDNSKSSRSLEIQSGPESGNNQSSHGPVSSHNAFDKHRPMLLGHHYPVDPYQYRPLFVHDNRSDDSGGHSYDDDKDSSLTSGGLASSKMDQDGGHRGGSTNKRISRSTLRRGADPIIFYTKARFYTDLSKDDESMPYNCPLYTQMVKSVVGMSDTSNDLPRENKGPISKLSMASLNSELERFEISPNIYGLMTVPTHSSTTDNTSDYTRSVPFEASGIGGVIPGDNFAINVDVQLERQSSGKMVATKVVGSKIVDMLPSVLPPPSHAFLPLSSSSESYNEDSDSDGVAEMIDEDAYERDLKSYVPLKFLNSFSSEGNSENADADIDDMSDDSSIDMLAHAREMEPETVAAAEREFDENISVNEEHQRVEVAPPASSIVVTLGEQSFEKEDSTEKGVAKSHQADKNNNPISRGKKRGQNEIKAKDEIKPNAKQRRRRV